MTNTKLFRDIVKSTGIKYKYLANSLGLSYAGLKAKIENDREFKAKEIQITSEVLNLDNETRDKIIFYK